MERASLPPATPDFPEWLDFSVAIGSAVSGLAGAAAAIAVIVAAWAAVRQARRSTEAARDALEALGRVLRLERIGINVWQGNNESQDMRTPEQWPGPLRVQVRNHGRPTAENVVVTLTDAHGRRWPRLGPRLTPGQPVLTLAGLTLMLSSEQAFM
ncbi:hypothetical protein [Pseudonocardia nigra]|uniref:hypothetical protein n=1 Tax=Pseudonocardia nigra TaxID=1921578 RepID=UPI001C5D6F36|nr:hypothetical protein [Pseudonocardia nigra]